MKNAILGTDLSAASDRIIENSAEFKLFGISRIILVYVLNLRSTEDFAEYNLSSAQDKLDDQKKHLLGLGFEAETKIVMGSQGRGYISEFFLGSVSLRVSREAGSNVLIIPFSRKFTF